MLLRPTRYINSAAPEFSPGQFFNACKAFLVFVTALPCSVSLPRGRTGFLMRAFLMRARLFWYSSLPFLARYRYRVEGKTYLVRARLLWNRYCLSLLSIVTVSVVVGGLPTSIRSRLPCVKGKRSAVGGSEWLSGGQPEPPTGLAAASCQKSLIFD